jgi:hypothetical protein
VDAVRRDYLIANVSLGVGLAGLATAGILLLIGSGSDSQHDDSEKASRTLHWDVGADHAVGSILGTF